MIKCPQCGIEFEKEMEFCPLCFYGKATQNDAVGSENRISDVGRKDDKIHIAYTMLSGKQKRKLFWEISSMVMLSGIMVTAVIDLLTSRSITWSKYTITVCMVLMANITLISFLRHRILILLLGSFVCTSLLLVLLDFYNETMGWGTRLGIPLLFSLYMVICILIFIFRLNRQHGLNMLGTIFLAIGLLTICIDAIIGIYVHGRLALQWSLIVVVCLLPVAGLMFYIHYRLNKGAELRRFFHI